ncbi:hypothetical protein [Nocardia sp. NPDC052566]|uniref:hypothetical protein n=1 Tax=Nocardia sp. NPDC052566 TaxID=3364330 RepID=UPI0037CBF166
MAPPLIVDPEVFYKAAKTLVTLTTEINTAVTALLPGLPTNPGMGGDFPGVASWNTACHKLAGDVRKAVLAYSGALAHFADILNIAGYNWDAAEYNANIDPNRGTAPSIPARGAATAMADNGFPAMADPKGDNGAGLVMRGNGSSDTWEGAPNGRAPALSTAATAWRAFADSSELMLAPFTLKSAHDSFAGVQAPEVPDIQAAINALSGGVQGIRTGADTLATEIQDYHDKLLDARTNLSNAAPGAFTRHPGAVTTSTDDTSVTVTVNAELTGDDTRDAYTAFTTAYNGTDLRYYLTQATDAKGFRGVIFGPGVLDNVPQLEALLRLPWLVASGNQTDNTALIGDLATISTWQTPQAKLSALDLSQLDKYGPLVKSWAIMAVKYGNEAGVDPRLVLTMALQEGASLRTGYPKDGVNLWDALTNPATFKPNPDGPAAGALYDEGRIILDKGGISKHWPYAFNFDGPGNSIGLTNLKKDPFNEVVAAYPDKFSGKKWTDLAGNDDLAMQVTAWNLRLINDNAAMAAPDAFKETMPLNQFLGAAYNAGGTFGHAQQVVAGELPFTSGLPGQAKGSDELGHGRASNELTLGIANEILVGSGAFR